MRRSRLAFLILLAVCIVMQFPARSSASPGTSSHRDLYVNDASTTNDNWCTAPGDDSSTGADPDHPKASVQSILDEYDLEPGDIVHMDTGVYALSGDTVVAADDSGSADAPVTFEASPYGVTFDRGSTDPDGMAWKLGGWYITLTTAASDKYPGVEQRWMKVTGADYGVMVHGSQCTVSRCEASGNTNVGIYAGYYVANTLLEDCVAVSEEGGSGITADYGSSATIRNCTISGQGRIGLNLYGETVVLLNNIICADGPNSYGFVLSWCSITVSDFNDFHATNGARVGQLDGVDYLTLSSWRLASNLDANSLSLDPQFTDAGSGDFHLSPASPCIDTGDPTMLDPDGSRIDMGAYGGTEQSSPTPPGRRLWLRAPIGGETFPDQMSVRIEWVSVGTGWQAGDTVRFAYSADSGVSWTDIPGAVDAASGSYDWDISGLTPGARYRIAVICVQDESALAACPGDFRIRSGLSFYVNDGLNVNDEWCFAPGDDSNHGTDPDHPKASVQAILNTYDLEPGDIVRIDTGTYDLSANIVVSTADQGSVDAPVTFEASPYGVTINRVGEPRIVLPGRSRAAT